MAKSKNQRAKLLYVLDYLRHYSDEDHPVKTGEIIEYLERNGIEAERKSIYSDIENLIFAGYDIISQKGKNAGFYMASSDFELAELKLLVDSVQSSKFITEKKTNALVSKLESLTSIYNGRELQRQVHIFGRVKTDNEEIYYNVDKLDRAINKTQKVKFYYAQYTSDKKKEIRNEGEKYVISPYCLTFSDDNYYVVAYYEKYKKLVNFRVDRMSGVEITGEKSEDIKDVTGNDFNLSEYLKKTFDMFGGQTKRVKLECDNSLANAVIDKFGDKVFIIKNDKNSFTASVDVNVSPTFFAWVSTFGSKMKIIAPDGVKEEFKEHIKNILSLY